MSPVTYRTASPLAAGTYTVKGRYYVETGTQLIADINLCAIGLTNQVGETVPSIYDTVSDTTTSTTLEDIDGLTQNISIDLENLLKNGSQNLNIPLEADDVINVQIDDTIRVFVFGMVKRPGALEVKMSKRITLLQAIAQAGGLEDEAKQCGILIKRRNSDGKIINIKANLKDIIDDKRPAIELKEGDVVYVPESIW